MTAVKIGPKQYITIPKIFNSLHLRVGDFVETAVKGNAIVLTPQKLDPRNQERF